ncbi:MAG: flagellar brake protein [Bacteroidota bacterium]
MNIFQVDDYLQIEITSGKYQGVYNSRVINSEENELRIAAPRSDNGPVPLQKNDLLNICVFKKDAMYEFQSKVISPATRDFAYLTIYIPHLIKRKQRRADFRITINVPVEVLYFYRDGVPVAACTMNSVDLSAGGVKIETSEEFKAGEKYQMAIVLPSGNETEEIYLEAEVVRSERDPNPEPGSPNFYWTAFKFHDVAESKKQKILKFIYKQQELRLKGLI